MELLEDQANRMKQEIIIVGTFSQQSFLETHQCYRYRDRGHITSGQKIPSKESKVFRMRLIEIFCKSLPFKKLSF